MTNPPMHRSKIPRQIAWILPVVILILLLPLLIHLTLSPVEFNQFWIQKLQLSYGIASPETVADMILSAYSSGFNILSGKAIAGEPDFNDNIAMFNYVYSWIPPYAVTYPTERFYYFSTILDGVGRVTGNLRVADLDRGKISMAYFTVPDKVTQIFEITEKDGLAIKKIHDYLYEVTYKGKTIRMKFPIEDLFPPKHLNTLPEEEFVGQIHDESGIKLVLYFNHNATSFYEVLNEEDGLADTFARIDDSHILGKRTGFLYFIDKDYNRKILVGVDINNVYANNYYDGPADQVPIRAFIKEKISRAYPGTQDGAGTDDHGVYLNRSEWVRIAISPFHRFTNATEVLELNKKCSLNDSKTELWTCVTREWWNTPTWRQSMEDKLREEEAYLNSSLVLSVGDSASSS